MSVSHLASSTGTPLSELSPAAASYERWPKWLIAMMAQPLEPATLSLRSEVPKEQQPRAKQAHQLAINYLEAHPQKSLSPELTNDYYLVPRNLLGLPPSPLSNDQLTSYQGSSQSLSIQSEQRVESSLYSSELSEPPLSPNLTYTDPLKNRSLSLSYCPATPQPLYRSPTLENLPHRLYAERFHQRAASFQPTPSRTPTTPELPRHFSLPRGQTTSSIQQCAHSSACSSPRPAQLPRYFSLPHGGHKEPPQDPPLTPRPLSPQDPTAASRPYTTLTPTHSLETLDEDQPSPSSPTYEEWFESSYSCPSTLSPQSSSRNSSSSHSTRFDPCPNSSSHPSTLLTPASPVRLGQRPASIDHQLARLTALRIGDDVNDKSSFIKLFNGRLLEQEALRQVALEQAEKHGRSIYDFHTQQVKPESFGSARNGLLCLFECEDREVRRFALEQLIDVLHADPITEHSYCALPTTIKRLAEFTQLDRTKDFDVGVLRLLIQTYALSIMTLWLHSGISGSTIPKKDRDEIWLQAEAFRLQIIPSSSSSLSSTKLPTSDPVICFWVDFAKEAALRLRTEVTEVQEKLLRAAHFSIGLMSLGSMLYRGKFSSEGVVKAVEDLKKAFYPISWDKPWLEPLLSFHVLAQIVRYDPRHLEELVQMVFEYKTTQKRSEPFLGMTGPLESLLLQTASPKVAEQCFKMLITNLLFDDVSVKRQIIDALRRLQVKGQACISTTAECLLLLIYETMGNLRSAIGEGMECDPHPVRAHFSELYESEKQLATHCMALYIRRIIDIQTESGLSQESLLAQIARSQTGDLDGSGLARVDAVLRALGRILPKPLAPDAEGNTLLHYCVIRGNRNLIPRLGKIFPNQINYNAVNYSGKTPLMLCVDPDYPTFLEAIPLLAAEGADPNICDKRGHSFWHYLVELEGISVEDIAYILEANLWRSDLDLNLDLRDSTGMTALMRCLDRKAPKREIAKLLIQHGASLELANKDHITGLEMLVALGELELIKEVPHQTLGMVVHTMSVLGLCALYQQPRLADYILKQPVDYPFSALDIVLSVRAATHVGSGEQMISVLTQHCDHQVALSQKFRETLPFFSWEQKGDRIQFYFEDQPVSFEELQQAVKGERYTSLAAQVLRINEISLACFKGSCATLEQIEDALRRRPAALYELDALGRNSLQIALLEGDRAKIHFLCRYERQRLGNRDFAGNEPLHFAAVTLNAQAYQRLLEKGADPLSANDQGHIPLVLALNLPTRMRPYPVANQNPYPQLSPPEADEDPYLTYHPHFCQILHLTQQQIAARRSSAGAEQGSKKEYTTLEEYHTEGWTLLHFAAAYGHPLQAHELTRCLPSLICTQLPSTQGEGEGCTPLELALYHERADVALAMIEGWLQQDSDHSVSKLSALLAECKISLPMLLAELGATSLLKHLYLDASDRSQTPTLSFANPNLTHYQPCLPIESAIRSGQLEILKLFSKAPEGCKQLLSNRDDQGNLALMLAARHRQLDCLDFILNLAQEQQQLESLLHAKNFLGQNVLHILCCTRRAQALDLLIEQHHLSTSRALERLDEELLECFERLYKAGVDLFQTDEAGNNALHLMSAYNHAPMIEHLVKLAHQASSCDWRRLFSATNDNGRTPIFLSVANASSEAFHCLRNLRTRYRLELGDGRRDLFGLQLIHIAAQEGHLKMCQELVNEPVDLFAKDDMGETAIHKAAYNRRVETLRYLLNVAQKDPHLYQPDHSGLTALHKAALQPLLQRNNARRQLEQLISTASGLKKTTPSKSEVSSPRRRLRFLSSPFTPATADEESNSSSPALAHLPLIPLPELERPAAQREPSRYPLPSSPQPNRSAGEPTPSKRRGSVFPNPGCAITPLRKEYAHRWSEAQEPLSLLKSSSQLRQPNHLSAQETQVILQIFTLLLEAGFEMEAQDAQGLTVWHYLCRGPYLEVMKHALQWYKQHHRKLDFSKLCSRSGHTIAHTCALFGQAEQLKAALAYLKGGLDLKSRGALAGVTCSQEPEGLTALSLAILTDHWEVANLLLDAGCRLDRTTRPDSPQKNLPKGNNVLHLLASKHYPVSNDSPAFRLFERISAKAPHLLMIPNTKGQLVLELAAGHCQLHLIPLLCIRMQEGKEALDALHRATELAQTLLSHTSCSISDQARQRQSRVLKYSDLPSYFGKGLPGLLRSLFLKPPSPPTLEELELRAHTHLCKALAIDEIAQLSTPSLATSSHSTSKLTFSPSSL